MSLKKITVEGVGGVKLSSDAALDKLLSIHGVTALIDNEEDKIVDFGTLVHGGRYTLGQPRRPEQQQQPEPEKQPEQQQQQQQQLFNAREECKRQLINYGWQPGKGKIHLPNFEPPEDALFHSMFKPDSDVPIDPNAQTKQPSLLLHDLENDKHSETDIYKHIENASNKGPSAIYGTSGIGKTRKCLEFLSKNYGFYFVAYTRHNEGSGDLELVIERLKKPLTKVKGLTKQDEKLQVSRENYKIVQSHLEKLLMARLTVFHVLKDGLGEDLTPHQWLLAQLSPRYFLGSKGDIFAWLTHKLIVENREVGLSFPTNMTCFIDEAQRLEKELPGFFLSEDGSRERSAYKSFLKAFSQLSRGRSLLSFPVFSGTGLSLWSLREETPSSMVKPAKYNDIYAKLEPLDKTSVQEYLGQFLDLQGIGGDLVSHVAAWLCGRPRWAASFVHTFITTTKKRNYIPRGTFHEAEYGLIEAIDRYVDRATSDNSNRLLSWKMTSSPYTAVCELFERAKNGRQETTATYELMQAAFRLAFTGKGKEIDDGAAKLIELGIASVVVGVGNNYVQCRVDEPLIVQSCINFFGIEKAVELEMRAKQNASERGFAFETFLIQALQGKWKHVAVQQLGNCNPASSHQVPQLSAYGVLVESCADVKETVAWLEKSKPDSGMGPDILFFLRDEEFKRHFCGVQTKFKDTSTPQKLSEALRTLWPEVFFCENRGTRNPTINLSDEDSELWNERKKRLFQYEEEEEVKDNGEHKRTQSKSNQKGKKRRKTGVVRVLVQYPSEAGEPATPGLVPVDSYKETSKDLENGGPHDALLVVDLKNAMFGKQEEFLKHVQEDKYKDIESSNQGQFN